MGCPYTSVAPYWSQQQQGGTTMTDLAIAREQTTTELADMAPGIHCVLAPAEHPYARFCAQLDRIEDGGHRLVGIAVTDPHMPGFTAWGDELEFVAANVYAVHREDRCDTGRDTSGRLVD
jgi:hypothetical protein